MTFNVTPASTSSTATQKAKLPWTTPRVVPLLAEGGTLGKTVVFSESAFGFSTYGPS